jgi:catechol 2,3-dioxygenase-like lactoylglutathione lyase family enzyme
MLDHLTIGVGDMDASVAFYDAALAPLGLKRLVEFVDTEFGEGGPRVIGYGAERPFFWIVGAECTSGKMHVAFQAKDRAAVEAFHAAALKAGGTDNGTPGLRAHYHPGYFGAFALDPNGFNVEAVFHGG